jgi:Tfp pilus assembly protein PilF
MMYNKENIQRKLIRASNANYNAALAKAEIKDLSGAIIFLKTAVNINKYNTDARNLLGLIYYEIGECADALTQWVISKNFEEYNPLADKYLNIVQKNTSELYDMSIALKKYNQSLKYLKQGSDDLGIIQLRKISALNPKHVKTHNLLALVYIKDKEYEKARRELIISLGIDKCNTIAIRLMSEVKSVLGSKRKTVKPRHKEPEVKETKVLLPSEDVIIPSAYKENTGWQTILQILFGIGVGIGVSLLVILPTNTRTFSEKNRLLIIDYNNKLASKDIDIDSLKTRVASLEEAKIAFEQDKIMIDSSIGEFTEQYNLLINALEQYILNNPNGAYNIFININMINMTDENFIRIHDWVSKLLREQAQEAQAAREAMEMQETFE